MRKLMRIGLPRTGEYRVGLFVSIIQALSAVALLATSAWLISRAAEQPPVMYLMVAVVGVRGFALGRAAGRYAERVILHNATFRMLSLQRPKLLQKLIPFAPAGLPDRGATISRLINDVDELQNLPVRVVAPLLQAVVVSVLAVIGVGLLVPSAAGALGLCLLGAFLIALPISGLVSKSSDESTLNAKAELSSGSLELLENLDVLKAFGWASVVLDELGKNTDGLLKKSVKSASAAGLGQALILVFSSMATFSLSFIGAQAVVAGQIDGVLLAVLVLLPMAVFEVVSSAQSLVSAWQKYQASASRIQDFLDTSIPSEIEESRGQIGLTQVDEISFNRASATYPNSEAGLQDFTMSIRFGDRVSLVGASGSGKTTVANLLLGFLNTRAGSLTINGKSISDFDPSSLRRVIGLVEQQPTIFVGSVRDNLLIAKPTASDDELLAVLDRVGLRATFETRESLNTELGERGVLISGGEAQRLGLARALLADFQVLILDEPTANVDQATALPLVRDLLAAAGPQRTVLLITHDDALAEFTSRKVQLTSRLD